MRELHPPLDHDPTPDELAALVLPLAESLIYLQLRKTAYLLPIEEVRSAVYLAVASSASRWSSYCAEHDYSPREVSYFFAYVKKRIQGAIVDYQRGQDPLTRPQRKQTNEARNLNLPDPSFFPDRRPVSLETIIELNRGGNDRSVASEGQDYTLAIADPAPNPESAFLYSETATSALRALQSLSFTHQLLVAYVYFKDPHYRSASDIQRPSSSAVKFIVAAVAQHLAPDRPLPFEVPDPLPYAKPHYPEVVRFLRDNKLTPGQLIDRLEVAISIEPGCLVDLARRVNRSRK